MRGEEQHVATNFKINFMVKSRFLLYTRQNVGLLTNFAKKSVSNSIDSRKEYPKFSLPNQ